MQSKVLRRIVLERELNRLFLELGITDHGVS